MVVMDLQFVLICFGGFFLGKHSGGGGFPDA